MDISKRYIMMCEKAEEIQGKVYFNQSHEIPNLFFCKEMRYFCETCKSFKIGQIDLLYPKYCFDCGTRLHLNDFREEVRWISILSYKDLELLKGEKIIWLPRQDQIQELAAKDPDGIEDIHSLFNRFNHHQMNTIPMLGATGEKLWLAFLMKDKYDKVWREKKEDWIKIRYKEGRL